MSCREKLLLRNFRGRTPLRTRSFDPKRCVSLCGTYAHANKRDEGSLVSHMPDQVSRLGISM